jgi:hypothetical protein
MDQATHRLDRPRGDRVLAQIRTVYLHPGWRPLAAQVRSKHAPGAVEAEVRPVRSLGDFKAYANAV